MADYKTVFKMSIINMFKELKVDMNKCQKCKIQLKGNKIVRIQFIKEIESLKTRQAEVKFIRQIL